MPETHLIPFTDDELNAIFLAIEGSPTMGPETEDDLQRVLDKITPAKVGDWRPAGAVDA